MYVSPTPFRRKSCIGTYYESIIELFEANQFGLIPIIVIDDVIGDTFGC